MIYPDLIGADGAVTEEQFVRAEFDVAQAIAASMAHEITGVAAERGITVHEDDVFVWRRAEDKQQHVVFFAAVWAPDPLVRGVELYGGSHDGEIVKVPRDDGPGSSLPPRTLRVMAEQPTRFDDIANEEPPPETDLLVEDYHRAGIDPDKRRFIYMIQRHN